MEKTHTYRKRALLYVCLLVLVYVTLFATGLGSQRFSQGSQAQNKFGAMAGLALLLGFIYTIPFIIYIVKFWVSTQHPSALPPADSQLHTLDVQYKTSFSFWILPGKHARLTWNNSEKVLSLAMTQTASESVIFKSSFKDIQKLDVNINMLSVKVNNITYTCTPDSPLLTMSTIGGVLADDQLASIVIGGVKIKLAGVPELAERIRAEGVAVRYTRVSRSLEWGVLYSFIAFFFAAILISVFVVK